MQRALIIDKHPLVRLALYDLLTNEDFTEISEANCNEDVLKHAHQLRPELIIMGINQYAELILLQKLTFLPITSKILVYTAVSKAHFYEHNLVASVAAIICKTEQLSAMRDAIRGAALDGRRIH
ncbi:response regulator [Glaciimonas soli]|nr:response regulator [Glaciimonas soli]